MKKIFSFVLFLAVALLMGSCKKNKIEVTNGVIKYITDSTITMVLDNNKVVFDTKQAQYTNGAVMQNDSVRIDYIGDLSDKKATALIVFLYQPEGRIVKAVYDSSKKLESKPASKKTKEGYNKFMKIAKEHLK